MKQLITVLSLAVCACSAQTNGAYDASAGADMDPPVNAPPASAPPAGAGTASGAGTMQRTGGYPTYRTGPRAMFHAASVTGLLSIAPGCLSLTAGGRRYLLVLPEGEFTVSPDGATLNFAGKQFRSGATISVGGSAQGGMGLTLPSPESYAHCSHDGIWVVARNGMQAGAAG
jgi:hypothetical protein